MTRMVLACSVLMLGPLLTGCCSCGYSNPCGGNGNLTYGTGYYGECLAPSGGRPAIQNPGTCHNCQGDGGYALPPSPSAPQSRTTTTPGYGYQPGYNYPPGSFPVGPETVGPEVVTGPAYVPGDTGWVYENGTPVHLPANPFSYSYSPGSSNALLPPAPIPTIPANSVVVPAPAPSGYPMPDISTGPMMPPVPPPPAEPVSQMRYRRYR